MATKIVIDAGHGGYDNGASFEGRNEKDDTLRLALAVGNILSQRGYEVVYTRVNAELEKLGFRNNVSDNTLFDNQFENIAVAIANWITETVSPSQNNYKVQVGLYRRYGNALFQLNEIIEDGFTGEIVNTSGLYGMWVGNENSLAEARQLEQRLQTLGYDTLIVKQ